MEAQLSGCGILAGHSASRFPGAKYQSPRLPSDLSSRETANMRQEENLFWGVVRSPVR